jgi:gliding motility-associated-like protein
MNTVTMNRHLLQHLLKRHFICILFLLVLTATSIAQVQIDSIKTTASTCPNNGSITVFAHSPALPLLYSITAGPVTAPTQTNNIFSSLPSGSYTIKVSDASANSLTQNATIAGNYISLDLNPTITNPYCTGNSNGKIIGNKTAGTGNGPFTWQLIAPSPITTLPQVSDTFNNLPVGSYTIKLSDACGSYTTYNSTLTDPNTKSNFTYNGVTIEVIGCDSAWVTSFVQLPPSTLRLPLTYKYLTKNGTYIPPAGSTVIDSTQLHTTGVIIIGQMVPNISYGDSVQSVIHNTCGDSLNITATIYPYTFHPVYSFNGCGNIANVSFLYPPDFSPYFGFRVPATYSFVDDATNAVVDAGTLTQDPTHSYGSIQYSVNINGMLPVNKTYTFTIKDGCGKVFTQQYTIPAKAPPQIIGMGTIVPFACIDSAIGNYRIHTIGFSSGTLLIVTSGPSTFGSTKAKFAYTDTRHYPDTTTIFGSGDQYSFLQFLTAGQYYFKVIDTCGNEIDSSFIINPSDVTTNLQENITYTKGCLGQNKIYYAVSEGTAIIRNIATNTILKSQDYYNSSNVDSILNVPTGSYELTLNSSQGSYGTVINNTYTSCWTTRDTITIAPYQTPAVASNNYIICKGGTTVELIPDSTKGVPPYQYEIIAGPQTFPVQNSNLFPITQGGVYQARIADACGNANTNQVTIDSIALPPVNIIANSCGSTKLFYGSSVYFTYNWTKPNGTTYTGDTLTVNPITAADTGIYQIQKIVNINSCTDTFTTSYHLSLIATHEQTIQFCTGTIVHVGSSTYTTPGIYTDTLTNVNSFHCDSVVITSLIAMQKKDTNTVKICPGGNVTVGTNIYTVPGLYKDSVANAAGCYDLIFTNLIINQLRDTVNTSICSVDSIIIGSNVHKTAGTYIDTLTSHSGCDSIVVLNLTVNPLHVITIPLIDSEIICQGDSLPFGTTLYTTSGIYQDTLVTGCVGLAITVNVTVNSYKKDSIVQNICTGQSYTLGTATYTISGIYRDTLTTLTCDSIVILNLTVGSCPPGLCLPTASVIDTSICPGQNYLGHNSSGTYTNILTNAGGCDSTVTSHLIIKTISPITIFTNAVTVDKGDIIQLGTAASAPYLWTSVEAINNNSIQDPTAIINNAAWIYLYATSNCPTKDSIFISVKADSINTTSPCIGSYIYMPNAFTPNRDGQNDVFKIMAQNITLDDFQIYNRWGQMVFETSDINKGWNGEYQGQISAGNYVYWLSYFDCDHITIPKIIKGNILLLR